MEKENKTIGIVKGIQGNNWVTVKVIGQTNHAGPTPMEHRKDALVPAAKMIIKINELTKEIDRTKNYRRKSICKTECNKCSSR